MLEYLKELLQDFNCDEILIKNKQQKKIAIETAIEILEKLKNNERRCKNV